MNGAMLDNIRDAAGCLGMILLWTVGGSLLLGVFAVPGIASWYLADRWWNQGDLGAIAPYIVAWLIYALTDAEGRGVLAVAAASFALTVPAVYGLVLCWQAITGKFSYAHPLGGVLIGSGLGILFTLKGAFQRAQKSASADLVDLFVDGLPLRIAFAFMVAALAGTPANTADLLQLGAVWGVLAATSQLVYGHLVKDETPRDAWIRFVILELILAFAGVVGGLVAIIDRQQLSILVLIPAAGAGAAVTYLPFLARWRLRSR
jgi:hypothetical protein